MIPTSITINDDFRFKRSIYVLLDTLREEMDVQEFFTYITELDTRLGSLPNNVFAESRQFFYEAVRMLFDELQPHYEIQHRATSRGPKENDSFTFQLKEEPRQMVRQFKKYRRSVRFTNMYLKRNHPDLYKQMRTLGVDNPLYRRSHVGDNEELLYVANRFDHNLHIALPMDSNDNIVGLSFTSGYLREIKQLVSSELKHIERLSQHHTSLQAALVQFEAELLEVSKAEYNIFGLTQLKNILERLIVPGQVIAGKELRSEFQTVFIRQPNLERLMPLGSSVYIYAADPEDDSTYLAKPVLVTDEAPADVDGLQFLGIGQFTGYDDKSVRSLNGASPYVINNHLYVKATLEDFLPAFPEELQAQMEQDNDKLKELGKEEDDLIALYDEDHLRIKGKLQQAVFKEKKTLLNDYLRLLTALEPEEAVTEPPGDGKPKFSETNLTVNPDLFWRKSPNYKPVTILRLEDDTYAAVRINEGSRLEMCMVPTLTEAFRILETKPGIYTIYSFTKRNLPKNRAFHTIFNFQG